MTGTTYTPTLRPGMSVAELLEATRARFGATRMADDDGSGAAAPGTTVTVVPDEGGTTDPADLGESGKAALAAERKAAADAERARKASEARATKAEQQLEQLRKAQQTDAERALEEARATAKAEALAPAKARVLDAELRAAAKGVLADPADAVRYADLVTLPDVGDDLTVDGTALAKAVADLLKAKPHLAAAPRTPGSADGGARQTSSVPSDASPTSRMAAAYASSRSSR